MINESYLSEVHSHSKDEDQISFQEYTETDVDEFGTTIAVVTEPTGGITDVCDEFIPSLGMPEDLLNQFREVRSDLDIDDDIQRHNEAAQEVQLEEQYKKYVKENEIAAAEIESLCQRVQEGEKITVVCFEKEPKWCHRHVLTDLIQEKISK